MKTKRIIQVALLLFVAVSVVYLVIQEFQKPAAAVASQAVSTGAATADTKPVKVVAYYFHGNFRCASCRKLESVSHEAVINGFAEELQRGDLQWRTVNVEQSENEHFVSDYRLFSRVLVLVRFKDGKQVEYKTLMKSWELLGDDEALKKYVQAEVQAYLQES
jgi:hypothetical protein